MSTQTDTIPFNINSYVSVKLTPLGVKQYFLAQQEFGHLSKGPEIDPQGWTRFQMHELMNIYGECLGPGAPLMFETDILLHTKHP